MDEIEFDYGRLKAAESRISEAVAELLSAQAEATHGTTANAQFIDGCVDRALALLRGESK